MAREVRFGLGHGAVYPHQKAGLLLHPLRRFLHSPTRLAASIGLAPNMIVLELGPGPGYFSVEIAKRLPQGRLVQLDLQREMIEMARARLAAAGEMRDAQVQADALSLPFRDRAFDAAVLVAMLAEVPEPGACLIEVARTLKLGGTLAVSEARGDPDRLKYESLRDLAIAAGLVPLQERAGRGWSYTVRFTKPA